VGATAEELLPVLEAFRAPGVSFLTPYAPAPIDEKTPIDVSHEALIRCWRRISAKENGWLQKEFREGLGWRTLLFQADSFASDKSNYLSEPATELGERHLKERSEPWAERYGDGWPKVEALVEASREHWKREAERQEANRQNEIDNERLQREAAEQSAVISRQRAEAAERDSRIDKERALRSRLVAFVVSIGALIMLAIAGFYYWEARQSSNRETHALAALSSAAAREGRVLDGVQLALAAWPRRSSFFERPMLEETVRALADSFSKRPPTMIMNTGGPIHAAIFTEDERRVLSLSEDGTMRLWDVDTAQPLGVVMRDQGRVDLRALHRKRSAHCVAFCR
jgi:hypothetical protein